ncbi:PREDICTED: myb-like protein L [Theobroma cacao]|uniref:Myb-like protein L n=1 Tax=Theobroma cacao TaxID=3641 RepID=A0AB32W7Z9_THECC|nr:PREDICTED: myb-like protein L [Theobroma cacao]
MSLHDQYDTGKEKDREAEEVDEEEEELSISDNDDGFDEDMEALKQACLRTGADLNDLQITASDNDRPSTSDAAVSSAALAYTDSEDDMEIFRSIRSRFALSVDVCEPLSIQPPCTLPPISSDDDAEDDFETLRVIQRRFSAYSSNDTQGISTEDHIEKTEPIYMTSTPLQDATCNDICERFQDYEKAGNISHLLSGNAEMQPVGLVQWDHSDANELSTLADNSSRFPKSAQQLIDAIKKNRSYQKFLRSKLTQIESKIEENKKLKERVKILKDFQVSCKKITGRSLSINKDPRIQLISARKSRTSKDPELLQVNDKNVSADYGPPENSSVTNYRMALTKFPLALQRKKWSREERENLVKGIRQQFQESALQVSVDWFSSADGSSGDGSNLDDIIATVKDLEITPERIREFLPKVNWDQLASMYVKGRSGAECETRWLNHEDPLINCNPWTAEEDKNLLFIVQEKGISNWFDIVVSLGSNRTPFQCLARYQRSLNACILKREWTEEEDDQLRIAVEVFGECDWQSVASTLKGRTGTQCSNRWIKSLHPTRQRVGRWTHDEDKRLKVAVMLFGPKNWRKIAEVIPGRTQVQCRERWVNSLDPALNLGRWTKEEDLRLEAAIEEHGYYWSKVATCMPSRTDNQCWRRWKTLHPKAVPLLQEARRIRKATLVSNFVDRESERPALGPNDFYIPLQLTNSTSEPENTNLPSKGKRKERRRIISAEDFENLPSSKKVEKRGNSSLRQHSRSRKRNELSGAKDDATLASFLQDKLKKNIPSYADGDEMKLAGFLRNKSKKRRHQIAENAHLSIMKGPEQRDKTNQIQFGLQRCEAKTNCDGVIPENSMFRSSLKQTIMSSDMNIVGDDIVNDTVAPHEVVREPDRIDQEGNCEADGITLVQLRKRLKKRGPASSCMRRESELPSKELDEPRHND